MSKFQDYISGLERQGRKTAVIEGVAWAQYVESGTVSKVPFYDLSPPSDASVRKAMSSFKPRILTYAVRAANEAEANGYLYATWNKDYDLEKLDKNARRDARRAQRCFEFKFMDWSEVRAKGAKCFHDARSRNGLTDGDATSFEKVVSFAEKMGVDRALGAFSVEDGSLGGFIIFTEVEDWIEITGAYSDNDHLKNCPNNCVFDFMQQYYLAEGRAKVVSYGYSSIQNGSSRDGLHAFKERIGFEAVPIRRNFILSPGLRLVANPILLGLIRLALKAQPGSRVLNKAEGMLSILLNKQK